MIEEAQKYLLENHMDGWLLYDFRKSNELAYYALKIPETSIATRRFFYWIPKKGEPIKLVHAIEGHILDHLPGEKRSYLSWQSLESELANLLQGCKKIAMEYSFKNRIPYVCRVDGGTIDLVRSFGVEVASSSDFLGYFTACLNEKQMASQKRAGKAVDAIVANAWDLIAEHLKSGKKITEYDVQQAISQEFKKRKMVTDHDPIVAINEHSADPHFEPLPNRSSPIQKGDFILIDLWGKEEGEDGIFADITRVGFAGKAPSEKQHKVFQIVREAQKKAIELVTSRFKEKKRVEGREVDIAARKVIEDAGFGKYFIHRTGHSIEKTLHGSGTHMDNLEINDSRPILPRSCFSIEPGIYLPGEFGVRLELDVLITEDNQVLITGGEQDEITLLNL